MSKQIFKKNIPYEILFNFLEDICEKNNKYYLINKACFKKGLFENNPTDECKNKLELFCSTINEYYHNSKNYYITRKLNYSRFVTIIRQICKNNHILFTSKIKYDKSNYDIIYYIYHQ